MKTYKILVIGPFSAGKTTFVRTLCEKYIDTDMKLREPIGEKTKTTVALDFGVVELGEKRVRLYGAPGQKFFFFMWEVLSKGLDGYILLIDGENPNALLEAEDVYRFFRIMLPKTPHVIAVNKFGRPGFSLDLRDVRIALSVPEDVPIKLVDARDYDSALSVVKLIVELIESRRVKEEAK